MRYLALLAAAALLFAGCEDPKPPTREAQKPITEQQKTDMKEVAKNSNQFACDLYAQLRSQEGNLFFSPTSISTALSMTLAGARSSTAEQMREVLHLDLPDDQLFAAYAALRQQLLSDQQGLQVSVANRLWGQQGFKFQPAFLSITKGDFGAELGQVDFVSETEAARTEINDWVAAQTNNKIEDLIPSGALNTYTRLVLTNAIYFKGDWARQFKANSTHDGDFHVAADKDVTVPFMHMESSFRFGEADGISFLEMPYKDEKCSMWMFLPAEVDGLDALEEKLTEENLSNWMDAAKRNTVIVGIPKFSLNSEFQLNNVLSAMGMTDAFSEATADFSGMSTEQKLFISVVIHKAFVDVNEKGTEAAAATGIAVGATSAPADPKVFRADHPFVYMIRDNETGSIMFLGRVTNPQ